MSAPTWEPVPSYWCIVLRGNITIDVDEKSAVNAFHIRRINPDQALDIRDIYGAQHLAYAGDVWVVFESTAEVRERMRVQQDLHEEEGYDGEEDETEAWRRG